MPPVLAASLTLARWLGPWAGQALPSGVRRETATLSGSEPFGAHVYRPRAGAPRGAYVVAPGLHHLGPDDPRLDRFCRALASAGFLVVAPLLPSSRALLVSPAATDDLAVTFDHTDALARTEGAPSPAIFSVSFGSLPAITLAARPSHRDRVAALVLFGGFADFAATVRFALTGRTIEDGQRVVRARDVLNPPALFLNLLPHLPLAADVDRAALARAWRAMVAATWGRMELKAPGARDPYAHRVAATLPAALRPLFLVGCDLAPGAAELLEVGLARAGDAFAFCDPRPSLGAVRCPIGIVHGRDDDVIACTESEKLVGALAPGHPHALHLTGFYDHTSSSLPRPSALLRELRTLGAVLRLLACAPVGRLG